MPIALELIQYQREDSFPNKLEGLIAGVYKEIDLELYQTNRDLLKDSPSIPKIEKLIKDRFNLTVIFDPLFSDYYIAATVPFMSDYLSETSSLRNIGPGLISRLYDGDNIFARIKELDKEKEQCYKHIHNKTGFIDTKNARVGGYLAEVRNYLIINFKELKTLGIAPSEATAITLHELGHVFTGLESHHRIQTTNSTVIDILSDINDNKEDKALYKFKKYFSDADFKDASLSTKKDITDFYGKLAKAYAGSLSSQLINSKYDETNFENMADSFAVRFGLGENLIAGLHKLHIASGTLLNKDSGLLWSLVTIDALGTIALLGIFGATFMAVAVATLAILLNVTDTTMTYDDPMSRYNRIKNGIINILKDPELPANITKDLINQFIYIDAVMKNSMQFQTLIGRIIEPLDLFHRTDKYYIRLQQDIENSLNNALFLKSSQLRVA